MSKINAAIGDMISKLQERLTLVSSKTRQNTDAVATLSDKLRLDVGKLQLWNSNIVFDYQARIATLQGQLNEKTRKVEGLAIDTNEKINRAQLAMVAQGKRVDGLSSYVEILSGRIAELEKCEDQQNLRDQNNVAGMHKIADETQKSFQAVGKDVEELMKRIQRLNERMEKAEDRVRLVEDKVASPAYYLGYEARIEAGFKLRLIAAGLSDPAEAIEPFKFHEEIVSLETQPYGLLITVRSGDRYILCGGPTPTTMFVNFYKKA